MWKFKFFSRPEIFAFVQTGTTTTKGQCVPTPPTPPLQLAVGAATENGPRLTGTTPRAVEEDTLADVRRDFITREVAVIALNETV